MNTRSASAGGISRICRSRLRRRSRTRSKSPASSLGRVIMSASSASDGAADRSSVVRPTSVASEPTSVSSCAPSRAERFVQRERIEVAAPFVEEIAGDRREPGTVGRDRTTAPRANQHQHRQERHFAVHGRPGVEAVRPAAGGGSRGTQTPARDPTAAGAIDRQTSGYRDRLRTVERQSRRGRGVRRSARRAHRPASASAARTSPAASARR